MSRKDELKMELLSSNKVTQIAEQMKALLHYKSKKDITNQQDYEETAKILYQLREAYAEAEERRLRESKPFRTAVTTWNSMCKTITVPMKETERHLTELMKIYALKHMNKETEQVLAIAENAEARGEEQYAIDLRANLNSMSNVPNSCMKARVNWKAEVTNLKEVLLAVIEGDLPTDLITIKQKDLDDIAKKVQDTKKIDGLKIYRDLVLTR